MDSMIQRAEGQDLNDELKPLQPREEVQLIGFLFSCQAMRAFDFLAGKTVPHGLYPIRINPSSGKFTSSQVRVSNNRMPAAEATRHHNHTSAHPGW